MSEGLVPVQKTVTRKGVTFEQTYHVRPQDIRNKMGRGTGANSFTPTTNDVADAIQLAGGPDGYQAMRVIAEYVKGTTAPEALNMRGALVAMTADDPGGGLAAETAIMERQLASETLIAYRGGNASKELARGMKDERLKQNINAMAAVSQAMHDEETVTLYRGVSPRQLQNVQETGGLRTGVTASFSEDPKAAQYFADKTGGKVLKVTVPRSSIVLSHRAFSRDILPEKGMLPHEKEVVVATKGRLTGFEVVDATTALRYPGKAVMTLGTAAVGTLGSTDARMHARTHARLLAAGLQVIALRGQAQRGRGGRTVAGRKRMAKYADTLQALAKERARRAMAVDLAELRQEIDAAKDFDDLRRRVVNRYKGRMDGKSLCRVVERANLMAHLAGQLGAQEDL